MTPLSASGTHYKLKTLLFQLNTIQPASEVLWLGKVDWHQARPTVCEHRLELLLIAQDLMTTPPALLTPDNNLYEALMRFLNTDQKECLIVNPENRNQVLGVLRHDDLIHAYNQEISRRKEGPQEKSSVTS